MTGPVVEWARRWLGVAHIEWRLRQVEAENQRLRLDVEGCERARLSAVLRNELADYKAEFFHDPYDHFATGYAAGLEAAADLLDGDR